VRPLHLNLPRLVPVVLLLFLNAACSGTDLGQIDESVDSREEMAGPGIFSDDQGESSLKWSNDSSEPSSTATAATVATATDTSVTQEQAEFEQFKAWNDLRSNGSESAEYQEFQQWLEYQKFKSNQ
jgi:hypothetical protein